METLEAPPNMEVGWSQFRRQTAEERSLVYLLLHGTQGKSIQTVKEVHAASPFVPLTPCEIFAALKPKILKSREKGEKLLARIKHGL